MISLTTATTSTTSTTLSPDAAALAHLMAALPDGAGLIADQICMTLGWTKPKTEVVAGKDGKAVDVTTDVPDINRFRRAVKEAVEKLEAHAKKNGGGPSLYCVKASQCVRESGAVLHGDVHPSAMVWQMADAKSRIAQVANQSHASDATSRIQTSVSKKLTHIAGMRNSKAKEHVEKSVDALLEAQVAIGTATAEFGMARDVKANCPTPSTAWVRHCPQRRCWPPSDPRGQFTGRWCSSPAPCDVSALNREESNARD